MLIKDVGLFDEDLQIKEDVELWHRIIQSGYEIRELNSDKCYALHLESIRRFTLGGIVYRAFAYGYWWFILFYKNRSYIKHGFPLKTLLFILVVIIMNILLQLNITEQIMVLATILSLWIVARLLRNKKKVMFCIKNLESLRKKFFAVIIIAIVEILMGIATEIGKIYALLTLTLSRKIHYNIR